MHAHGTTTVLLLLEEVATTPNLQLTVIRDVAMIHPKVLQH